jgi:crossover junction endodeoxyribonuclease RusA
MRLELSYPDKALWPNGRPHWGTKRRAVQKAKDEAFWLAKTCKEPLVLGEGAIPVRIIVHPKKYGQPPDADNAVAAAKSAIDGIAAAIGINDRHFASPTVEFSPERSGKFVIFVGLP